MTDIRETMDFAQSSLNSRCDSECGESKSAAAVEVRLDTNTVANANVNVRGCGAQLATV